MYSSILHNLAIHCLQKNLKEWLKFNIHDWSSCMNNLHTWSWYSRTGISWPSLGPNCLRAAEYLIAMGRQIFKLTNAIPVIPTRPPESAPREAPNLLLGSWKFSNTTDFQIVNLTNKQIQKSDNDTNHRKDLRKIYGTKLYKICIAFLFLYFSGTLLWNLVIWNRY